MREVGGRGKGGARLFKDTGGEAAAGTVREGKRKRLVKTSLLPSKQPAPSAEAGRGRAEGRDVSD